jgi:hypothetical protein
MFILTQSRQPQKKFDRKQSQRKKSAKMSYHFHRFLLKFMAETTGFEPVVVFNDYNGLANRRFQPLSHVSAFKKTQTLF